MKYKAILFDMDGTLLDTLADMVSAVNHILSVHGWPLRTTEEVRTFVGNGARRLMERALPPAVTGEDFETVLAEYRDWYQAHNCVDTAPYAGIPAVLAALVWLLVWYVEQRVLAKSLGRVPEGADAQAAWEQHVLRKQGWTADSEQGQAALARVRAGVAAMQEQPHEDVFTPATDGTRLHARLYRVPHAHATVILCHGYHSHAEHDFSAQFPALYASGGCNLLLIDERAHGLSEGKCLTFGQLERYDIAQWVHWVREHSRVQRPIALYGVSMGAASVLLAAQLPELKGELACVVADCGYSSFELEITDAVRHGTNAPCWLQKPLARICVRILHRNGLDFAAVDTTPGMAALDIPILFFHGDADTFVPLHHSERNLAACRREQRLIVIPGAEHAMSAQVDPERYRHELLVFLWRNTNYLWAERDRPLK